MPAPDHVGRCHVLVLSQFATLALLVTMLTTCAPEAEESRRARRGPVVVPAEIAALASDALHAAAKVKTGGEVDAVLREHARSPLYAAAMSKHFALMGDLHRVGRQAQVRYSRSSVTVNHDQFCENGRVAHLVVTALVRYDMESIPPASGAPPYTASQEEHVFRFEWRDGVWAMAKHHEIGLDEMHRAELVARLRNPCGHPQ